MKPNSRAVALDLLQEVLVRQRSLDEAMERNIHWPELEPRDRAFARLLTSTTLRRLGEINQALDLFVTERLPPKARAVSDALRLGACQLFFLGTPSIWGAKRLWCWVLWVIYGKDSGATAELFRTSPQGVDTRAAGRWGLRLSCHTYPSCLPDHTQFGSAIPCDRSWTGCRRFGVSMKQSRQPGEACG